MTTQEITTVCGNQVQVDMSGGQGHCWRNVSRESLPADIALEIECEMIDGDQAACSDYVASNGQHYRW